MPGKISMNTSFAQLVLKAALDGCNALQIGEIRKGSQICGSSFWSSLTAPQQRLAGKIIAEAVATNQLPLTSLGRNLSNHQLYQRQ